jgi:short-subunit dehydrogenase involved in D-alanine esterification of teichoic acids
MTKKTILLTEAAQGIGLHLTQTFLKKNHNVIAVDIDVEWLKKAFEVPIHLKLSVQI